jgi:hypothetical protein
MLGGQARQITVHGGADPQTTADYLLQRAARRLGRRAQERRDDGALRRPGGRLQGLQCRGG